MFGSQSKPLSPPIRTAITALFLILILATALSVNHTLAIFGSLERANGVLTQLSYLLLFVCVATQINPQSSRQLLTILIVTAVPICLLGLAQAGGWQPLPLFSDARSPLTTTLGRANFSGAYLAMLLPLTLAAGQLAHNSRQRLFFGTLAILELIVIALTQARAAWIAAAVGIALFIWLQAAQNWSRRLRLASIAGGLLLLSGGLFLYVNKWFAFSGSIAARWTIWQASLRLLWPRLWLGYGADTLELIFPSAYPPQLVYYQGRGILVDRAHNWLLDYSLSYGIVATIFLIALFLLVLRQGWRQLTPNGVGDPQEEKALEPVWIMAAMASAGAYLIGNLFSFEVAATAVTFWLLLAVITASSTPNSLQGLPVAAPLWMRKAVIVLAFGFLVWAVWQGNMRPLQADFHSWRGTQSLSQGRTSDVTAEYAAAVKLQPQRAAYHTALASAAASAGDFGQAEQEMLAAAALRPADPEMFTQLAAIYGHAANGKIEQAYAAYDRAVALAPTIGLTAQKYADLALRSGDLATAQAQAQRAVDLDATDGLSFGILGWAYLGDGRLEESQKAFEQAVHWQPDSADFHLGLATVYAQLGRPTAARETLQRSLALDPDYAPALALQLDLQE